MLKFLKNWTLPIAMLVGAVGYPVFISFSFTSMGVKSFTAMTVSTPDVKFPANATVVPNPITNAIATIFFFHNLIFLTVIIL